MKSEGPTLDRIEATSTAVDDLVKPDLTKRHGVRQMEVENIALADAVAKDNPDYRSASQFKLYAMMGLCVLNGIMNGYDGSVMSAINAMEPFQDRFKIGMTGPMNGLTFSTCGVPKTYQQPTDILARYLHCWIHHRLSGLRIHHGPLGPTRRHVCRRIPHYPGLHHPGHEQPPPPVHRWPLHRRIR